MELTQSQRAALDYITNYARTYKDEAKATINHVLKMANIPNETYERVVEHIKAHARIALHFHPDRPDSTMKSIAAAMLAQGIYKSQFETLISNGSVSAYPGGARDLWEEKLFGGAYQLEGTSNSERPKYGALNLMHHPDGPAPRFGSCYFLLSPEVSHRSTFTYLDSHQAPKEMGTYEEFDMIMAALLEEVFTRDFAIGEKNLTPGKLINHLLTHLANDFTNLAGKQPSRNLNHYIEAQVHGDISLQRDVEILVADPSFKGTQVCRTLEGICQKYSIDLHWHMGFELRVDEVPDDFRGPSMPLLAKRIAQNDLINAQIIGAAVMDLKRNPNAWRGLGTVDEVLQELKLLWHVLVKFGKPYQE